MPERRKSETRLTCAIKPLAEMLEPRVLLSAATMVDKIDKLSLPSNPSNFAVAGNQLFFMADDGIHGTELWKSDGTSAGTVLVTDLVPGSAGSSPQPFAALGNDMFFTTAAGGLYITDGTAAGTVQLSTVTPNASNWSVYNGRLYFQGSDAGRGSELWTSDGTAAGTSLLADIASGTDSSSPSDLVPLNGAIYFSANTSTNGNELWKTDGTVAGTSIVADINPGAGSSNPSALATMNGKLYFIASSSGSTGNLYVSDGTAAGTSEVSTVPAAGLASNSTLSVVGSTLYFLGTDTTHGQELWKSNGTAAGTALFYDLTLGASSTTSISQMYSLNGSQYFWTYSISINQSQLWRTDGTAFGTSNFSATTGKIVTGLAAGNYLYYADKYGGLSRTDTTASNLAPTAINVTVGPNSVVELANLNGTILCNGGDTSDAVAAWENELRGILPGSSHATLIKNINTQMPYGSNPYDFVRVGNQAYFLADVGMPSTTNNQLWVTDGTEAGTHLVKQLNTTLFEGAAALGNSLLFFDYSNSFNGVPQLWKTNGTPAGTVMVQNNVYGTNQMATAGNLAYFSATYSGTGYELWATDGTTGGTRLVDDINPGKGDSSPSQFTSIGNEIYFQANDGIHGTQLWKSDGTARGTVMVSALSGVGNLIDLTNVGGTLYFVVASPVGTPIYVENLSLWKSDGTAAGTVQISDPAGQLAGSFDNLTAAGNELYFTANTAANGVELWKTDGTSAGTELVDDVMPGPDSSSPTSLEAMGSTLYFSAIDSSGEGQLFRTDGTAAGTIQLSHALTFDAPSLSDKRGVRALTAVGNTLFFVASDGVHGNELWSSDGTDAGTSMVQDIGPGDSISGYPQPLSMGNYMLFRPDGQPAEDELWRADAPLPPPGTGSISGAVFYDSNGNGQWDSNEGILPSWQVFLDTNDDGVNESDEPVVTCNSQGQYTFTNVLPGTYRVRLISQDLWTQTAPSGGTQFVTVSVGQTTTNVNFGEVPGDAYATPIASSNAIFIGDSYTLDLSYAGLYSATSWTVNWGDGTPMQTLPGNPAAISHTYGLPSGSSSFTILAWANSVDGSAPVVPMTVAVYAPPVLNNGLLSLTGTAGNDSVNLAEIPSGLLTVSFNGAFKQYNSSLPTRISYTDGGGDDSIEVQTFTIPATLNLTSGNDTITNGGFEPVYVAAGTGKMTINARVGSTIIPASSGPGVRQLHFAGINISNGAKLVLANSSATLGDYSHHANRSVAVIDPSGLTIASGGTLDMGDNDLILDYPGTQAAAHSLIASLVTTGYGTSKNFSGTGITSSQANYDSTQSGGTRALGWGDNADLGKTSFDGVTLTGTNQMLVKFTYYGDSNLDGIVDTGGDLALLAKGFHGQGSGWDFGDFNFDGATNNPDLSLYARGLNNGYRQFGTL